MSKAASFRTRVLVTRFHDREKIGITLTRNGNSKRLDRKEMELFFEAVRAHKDMELRVLDILDKIFDAFETPNLTIPNP